MRRGLGGMLGGGGTFGRGWYVVWMRVREGGTFGGGGVLLT